MGEYRESWGKGEGSFHILWLYKPLWKLGKKNVTLEKYFSFLTEESLFILV